MHSTSEVDSLRVGQRVITDTSRRATILELSSAFHMALIRFDNGLEDWWALTTLERITPDDLFKKAR
jgi:hypothetical protein